MSTQQKILAGLASLLILAAVPGLFMSPSNSTTSTPSDSSNSETSSGESLESQVTEAPSGVPDTELNLERSTQEARDEIIYARKVNINEAGNDALQTIPNVGPATAESIINFRKQGNVFYQVEDLDKVDGIGALTVEDLKPHITVGKEYMDEQPEESGAETEKIDVNSAGQSQLEQLPGIGSVTAQRIISYREANGPFGSIDDLDKVSGIGPGTLDDIRDQAVAY
jgi:competence ComEA-like helix-hairpin-helix protein